MEPLPTGAHKARVVREMFESDRDAYAYLPRSTAYLPEPHLPKQMLNEVGMTDVAREALAVGAAQLITGRRATS
ncbi:MAG: hypothetical protein M3N53_00620 [Actinomycetota bacterium]|nr:hypothetical protein [Actinomycetota bacterium]